MLTAAHCVKGVGMAIDAWTITVGTHQRDIPQSPNQTFKIENIVVHKYFQVKEEVFKVSPATFLNCHRQQDE